MELYVQTDESPGLLAPQLYVGAGLVESEGVASTGSQATGGNISNILSRIFFSLSQDRL